METFHFLVYYERSACNIEWFIQSSYGCHYELMIPVIHYDTPMIVHVYPASKWSLWFDDVKTVLNFYNPLQLVVLLCVAPLHSLLMPFLVHSEGFTLYLQAADKEGKHRLQEKMIRCQTACFKTHCFHVLIFWPNNDLMTGWKKRIMAG